MRGDDLVKVIAQQGRNLHFSQEKLDYLKDNHKKGEQKILNEQKDILKTIIKKSDKLLKQIDKLQITSTMDCESK